MATLTVVLGAVVVVMAVNRWMPRKLHGAGRARVRSLRSVEQSSMGEEGSVGEVAFVVVHSYLVPLQKLVVQRGPFLEEECRDEMLQRWLDVDGLENHRRHRHH